MLRITFFTCVVLVGSGAAALAQARHEDHAAMMTHGRPAESAATGGYVLTEPGQGAFAALSEVVRVLETDPTTDWSKVDLDALRAHLVDMDRLVFDTAVTLSDLPNGISVFATGDVNTLATLRRMVPAHAAQLAIDARWTVAVEDLGNGVKLTVTSDDPATVARIRGLGFFGLMASQDHHREHHMMIALGKLPHGQ